MARKPEIARCLGRHHELVDGIGLPLLGLAMERWRRKGVERLVIGRVHRHQLALEMGRELGDGEPMLPGNALDFLAIAA